MLERLQTFRDAFKNIGGFKSTDKTSLKAAKEDSIELGGVKGSTIELTIAFRIELTIEPAIK